MNRTERAKQFLPFDTLRGLREELAAREERHTRVEKAELSETQQAEISRVLSEMKKGEIAVVTYYLHGHYITLEAPLDLVDPVRRYLVLCEIRIPYSEILSVERPDDLR